MLESRNTNITTTIEDLKDFFTLSPTIIYSIYQKWFLIKLKTVKILILL
ncbi:MULTISPECIES: hypothetical protein [unclassified Clostridium]|nr:MULTISPECIES: hypothetical protein [unclassified Clostridium]